MRNSTANSKTAFIICGALGKEVLAIVRKYGWQVDVVGISAADHLLPERIAPDVEARIKQLREQYDRLMVVYGDCGTYGRLDAVLEKYGIERVAGPHCYEMYGGALFSERMESEPGTFFLTDFLVRTFQNSVVKGMGLDRYPELKQEYFRHYTRLLYLAQNPTPELLEKAEEIAGCLELPLEVQITGYGLLETRLVELMEK